MADSAVNNKSNSTENEELPCSTSSLTPANSILTDTSNSHDESKSLHTDESPVLQTERMEGVEHESPAQKNIEGVEHESPAQKNIEGVEHESPAQQNIEGVVQESPDQQNKEGPEQESPVQQNIEGVEQESSVQQNMEGVEQDSPEQQNKEGLEQESPVQQNKEGLEQESPVQQNMEGVEQDSPEQQNKEGLEQESPVQQNTEGVEQEPTTSNEKKNDFEIGDIVWAKIGRYPFWPSIVCIDPETNIYMKGSLQNKRQFSLHVRFCNDHGRRSWAKTVEMYSGKEALLSKYPNGLALIKNSKKQMSVWDVAVKEADNWLKVNRDDRMTRFARSNGLNRSKISGLGPKPPSPPTPSTSTAVTPQEFLAMQKALQTSCAPSTSGSQGINCEASTSGTNMRRCYVQLKDIKKKPMRKEPSEERAVPLPKVELPLPIPEPPKPKKRKYVDLEKKELREALKKKKAKRALQVKKYGFSYSSSEYESTDDEAEPLVPFNPNRKVLESIKYAVANLESEGMQRQREKRILIKAIRLAERRTSKKNKEEQEEEQEQEQ